MPAILERLGRGRTASRSLRCAARVHLDQHAPSLFRFVRELIDEGRPPGIRNGLGEHPRSQASDVQIFDHNQAEIANQPPADFVVGVGVLVFDVRVGGLQHSDRFASPVTALLASRHFALRLPQSGKGFTVVARVLNLSPVSRAGQPGLVRANRARLGVALL